MESYNNIYAKSVLTHHVSLSPEQIEDGIDEIILKQIKNDIEGKCSKEGYVKKDSVSVIKRSTGNLRNNEFTGDIHYQVLYSCLVCNPSNNQEIFCTVKQKNKMGVLAESGPLVIIIPFQHHDNANRTIFQNIEADKKIIVSVIGSRFNINDNKISVVGKLKEVLT